MFKKQRERSENFTTSGFGQKPVVQDLNSKKVEGKSESISGFPTKDNEQNYNPDEKKNLKEDLHLKSVEKVVYRNLSEKLPQDFVKAKVENTKLFTEEKSDMEDSGLQHPVEDSVPSNACPSSSTNGQISENLQDKVNFDNIKSSDVLTAVSPSHVKKGKTKLQPTTRVRYLENPNQYENFTSDEHRSHDFVKRKRRTRPRERLPWAETNTPTDDAASSQTNEDPFSSSQSFADNESYEETSQVTSKRRGHRSVKPPEPNVLPPRLFDINNVYIGANEEQDFELATNKYNVASRAPGKCWASVKFNPEKKTSQTTETREKAHSLLCTASSSEEESNRSTPAWIPTVTNHITTPIVKSLQKNPLTPSVALLHKPISPSTLPFSDANPENGRGSVELELTASDKLKKHSAPYSVRGDISPRNSSPQPLISGGVQTQKLLPSHNFNFPDSKLRNQDNHIHLAHRKQPSNHSQATGSLLNKDDDLKSSSVAACMKILDPNKGRYQPKMAVVYKPTPSIGAKLDEDDDERPSSRHSYSERIQFNKPVKVSADLPHISYIGNFQTTSSKSDKKLQALESNKQELKGKGAEIFEKQQKRMEIFTKESQDTENEFRSKPTEDSSNHSHATTTFNDKSHHHPQIFNVSRRPPSAADFVCVDDSSNFASDSIYSSPSSMTSYDRASYTSPTKQEHERSNEPTKIKIPPRPAPKPKFKRAISPDLIASATSTEDTGIK